MYTGNWPVSLHSDAHTNTKMYPVCVCVCVCVCTSYCRQYNWTHSHPVLVRPYDTTFIFYESTTDSHHMSVDDVFDWLTIHLSQHIDIISSLSQLQHDWLDATQPVSVIVCVNDTHVMPLFLAVLSVLLDRRVRFAQVPLSIASQAFTLPSHNQLTIVISTNQLTYVYGSGDADCMTMRAVRLLLTMLAPSAGDLLDPVSYTHLTLPTKRIV